MNTRTRIKTHQIRPPTKPSHQKQDQTTATQATWTLTRRERGKRDKVKREKKERQKISCKERTWSD